MSLRLFWAIENSNLFIQRVRHKADKDQVNDQAKSGFIPIVENPPKIAKESVNEIIHQGLAIHQGKLVVRSNPAMF